MLFLSFWYDSKNSTATVRTRQMSLAAKQFFTDVHVITSDRGGMEHQHIRVHDVQSFGLRKWIKKDRGQSVFQEQTKSSALFKILIRLKNSFPTNLLLAEANVFYIISAFRKASQLIQANHIDTIYSSFGPYGDHYIAYLIKLKFPNIKWVADFRDLHIDPMYQDVYCKGIQRWMEAKVLKKADLLTTISQGLLQYLEPYNSNTIKLMRGATCRPAQELYKRFTISYTGSLFRNFRDPRPLFQLLQDLKKEELISLQDLRIIYAGKDGKLFGDWVNECCLGEIFEHRGLVSRKEAQTIQDKSHINLLLTSASKTWTGILTGKVFEYFESGNATLCLINGTKDAEIEALFDSLDAGTVVYSPEIQIGKCRSFILDKYQEWKMTNTVNPVLNIQELQSNHSWESRIENMLNALKT